MVALGCGTFGCGGDALVSPRADGNGSPLDGGSVVLLDAGQTSFPDGPIVCTLVGCEDEVSITITVDGTQVPSGTYTLSVTADGTVGSCTFPFPPANPVLGVGSVEQCSSGLMMDLSPAEVCTTTVNGNVSYDQCQPVDGKFKETLTVAGTPTTVRVQQLAGAVVISDKTFSPNYQTNQPNGPLCGPTCHQANGSWTVP